MAYDKLCDSAALDAGLKQIADAIREKGGTSDSLAFPTAMAEAIAAIEAGGGVTLPYGYAMECGVYIPASDVTSANITMENTYKWNTTDRSGTTFAAMTGLDLYSGVSATYSAVAFYNFAGEDAQRAFFISDTGVVSSNSLLAVGFSTNTTSNLLRLTGNTSSVLKAGVSYFWIVVGEVK